MVMAVHIQDSFALVLSIDSVVIFFSVRKRKENKKLQDFCVIYISDVLHSNDKPDQLQVATKTTTATTTVCRVCTFYGIN